MMPQWTSDDGSASEFSTERALERRQFRNNRTMLVLKITIRLLVIYKRITKVRTANFIQEGYTLTEWEI
jgi:hypothetical protein